MAQEPKAEKKLSKPQHAIRKDGLESTPPLQPSITTFLLISFLFCFVIIEFNLKEVIKAI